MLIAGGFPEAIRRAPRSRARFFESYVQSIVDRDVATAGSIASPGRVGTLLRVADTGLLSALTGADDRRVITDDDLAGSILETFVTTELERQAAWSDRAYTFWHFRDGQREVDIVIESPSGDVVGIEVKFGARFDPRAMSGLAHLRDHLGGKFVAGLVMYAGGQTIPAGDRLWAVPLSALWSAR